ncbi:MAG TPA: radical SAM protein [Firmicutes bacterium]|nr:radical SAM protein [Bacillota bacterium]
MVIAYPIQDALYLNITNRCPNACLFCIRETTGGVGYNLWLNHEPSVHEIMMMVEEYGYHYREVVFCGYGEPLLRPEIVKEVAGKIKEHQVSVRLNTNGLADLFLGYDILPELAELIDTISISLNAENAAAYEKLTQSPYGINAFPAVLDFIRRSKLVIPKVVASVVRYPGVDIKKAALLAEDLKVDFRIRELME